MKKINTYISGAEALMRCLVAEGVDVIFGYPGGAIMPVYDALYDHKKEIRHVLVRHEQGAAHAAEGYALVTGRPGVCIATSGPGATNLVTGIGDAMMDSVPLVCITGQVAAHLVGTDAFQETDIVGITTPITKWNYQVTKPEEIPGVIAKAFHIAATGRPGPVLIDITKNAQTDSLEFAYKKVNQLASYKPNTVANPKQIKLAAELINQASKPLMLIGHGVLVSHAVDAVKKLSILGSIPVASTLLGLSALGYDHPQFVGMLGMHGNYGPNMLTNKADVIIAVGMRFDDRVTGRLSDYAKQAKVIHIDIDPAELNKNVLATVPIVADAKQALQELIPLIEKIDRSSWRAQFAALEKTEFSTVIKNQQDPKSGEITMTEAVTMISNVTNGDSIVVADVGQHQMEAARYYRFKKPHSFLNSGGAGTMGYALPAAIGAQIGRPDRSVVVIAGDGGFQMTLQELATIHQENLPIKIVILNNEYLGMVRQWQELFFSKRYSFVDLVNPDFVQVAKGFYIPGETVRAREDLKKALTKMVNTKGPYLLDIRVKKQTKVFPMIPTGAAVDEIQLEVVAPNLKAKS